MIRAKVWDSQHFLFDQFTTSQCGGKIRKKVQVKAKKFLQSTGAATSGPLFFGNVDFSLKLNFFRILPQYDVNWSKTKIVSLYRNTSKMDLPKTFNGSNGRDERSKEGSSCCQRCDTHGKY